MELSTVSGSVRVRSSMSGIGGAVGRCNRDATMMRAWRDAWGGVTPLVRVVWRARRTMFVQWVDCGATPTAVDSMRSYGRKVMVGWWKVRVRLLTLPQVGGLGEEVQLAPRFQAFGEPCMIRRSDA